MKMKFGTEQRTRGAVLCAEFPLIGLGMLVWEPLKFKVWEPAGFATTRHCVGYVATISSYPRRRVSVFPHDISKTVSARITKLAERMFRTMCLGNQFILGSKGQDQILNGRYGL